MKWDSWTDYFDQIFLVNLPDRPDKLEASQKELNARGIRHVIYEGMKYPENGAYGLLRTMFAMFNFCLKMGMKQILVFEDDLSFVENQNPNACMTDCIIQLPQEWHMLHLGPNTHEKLEQFSENLLLMNKCRSTHAVAYSERCMQLFVKAVKESQYAGNMEAKYQCHIDMYFEAEVQPLNKSYCTFPMLVTQRSGWSDILHKEMDQSYIAERFKENTKHLIQ